MLKYFSNEFDWLVVKRDAQKIIDNAIKTYDFIDGKYSRIFANNLKNFIGCKNVVLTKSGTQALELSLKAYGIGNGDKVITTPYTFIATISAIKSVGAIPVFVDIKHDTWNIDENKIEEKITNDVKAIIAVDIFGNPCNYNALKQIAKKRNLKLIADSCQSLTAEYDGRKIGNVCDVSCFSFYPTKPFGGFGEGGAIAINDEETYNTLKKLVDHGTDGNDNCVIDGTNGSFDMLHAVYINEKMKYINSVLEKRNIIANLYKQMKGITFQAQEENAVSAWCRIQAYTKNKNVVELIKSIFETNDLYCRDICDNEMYNTFRNENIVSADIAHNSISLPIYTHMNLKDLSKSIDEFNEKFENCK